MDTKIADLKKKFSHCTTPEALYREIMAWGKKLTYFKEEWKTLENRVSGCQSLMYLKGDAREDGVLSLYAASDALISAGLAALLIEVYSGSTPEQILKMQPTFLDEMGIPSALTPGRANGLAGLYLQIKREALKALVTLKSTKM